MQSEEGKRKRICIVGGGVIGMSSAYVILTQCSNVSVTVIADKFSPDTTGDVAAGFWTPFKYADTPHHLLRRWGSLTFDYLLKLNYSPEAKEAGVGLVSGWNIMTEPEPEPFFSDLTISFHYLTKADLAKLGFSDPTYYGAYAYTAPLCECRKYLPWLTQRFISKGGEVIQRFVNSFSELYADYDVIVNCVGLGAAKLVNDEQIVPYRGQVIRVDAPWIKHFLFVNDSTYIIPNSTCVILGGTAQRENWSKDVDENDTKGILERCSKHEPSLKHCRILSHDVGLRPVRTSVRLEGETVQTAQKKVPIIHNYGHGGSGVTLHWGCALDTCHLVQQALSDLKATAHL